MSWEGMAAAIERMRVVLLGEDGTEDEFRGLVAQLSVGIESMRATADRTGRAESLKFLATLASVGKLTPGVATDNAKQLMATLQASFVKLRPPVPSLLAHHRPRSNSVSAPRRIERVASVPSPLAGTSPPSSGPNSGPSSFSSRSVSPPRSPRRSVSVRMGVSEEVPERCRWSLSDSIVVPEAMTAAAAEAAILAFFDEMWQFRVVLEPSPGTGSPSTPPASFGQKLLGSKSPRTSQRIGGTRVKRKDQARIMANCFSLIHPLLEANNGDWNAIFVARCAITQVALRRDAVESMLQTTLELSSALSDEPVSRHLDSLVRFLSTNSLDLDSAVLGVEPAPSWASVLRFPPLLAAADAAAAPLSDRGGGDRSPGRKPSRGARAESLVVQDFRTLSERVIHMSQLEPEDIVWEVRSLARTLKREELRSVSVGAVVLAHYLDDGAERVAFCRLVRWSPSSDELLLSTGSKQVSVSCMQCAPLHAAMVTLLEQGRVDALVVRHDQAVRALLQARARSECAKLVLQCGAGDAAALARVVAAAEERGPLTLPDLPLAAVVAERVAEMTPDTDSYFADCEQLYREYANQLTWRSFSPIDRDEAVNRFFALHRSFVPLLSEAVETLNKSLRGLVRSLHLDVERILDGSRKVKMSSAWHSDVRNAVSAMLDRRGYDARAAPHDYISQPPTSIEAIRTNCAILRTLIRNEDQTSELTLTGERLAAQVYPMCDAFVRDALAVLCERLGLVLDATVDPVPQLRAVLAAADPGLHDKERYESVVSDIEYLREMRRLEDNLTEHNPHIVPISGLIMSSLVRKEKENLTILEVWDHSPLTDSDGGGGALSRFSGASLTSSDPN